MPQPDELSLNMLLLLLCVLLWFVLTRAQSSPTSQWMSQRHRSHQGASVGRGRRHQITGEAALQTRVGWLPGPDHHRGSHPQRRDGRLVQPGYVTCSMSTNKGYWLTRNPDSSYYDSYPDTMLSSLDVLTLFLYHKMQIWTQTSQMFKLVWMHDLKWQNYNLTNSVTDEKLSWSTNLIRLVTKRVGAWQCGCMILFIIDSSSDCFPWNVYKCGKKMPFTLSWSNRFLLVFVTENRKASHWKSCNWRMFGICAWKFSESVYW